MRVLIIMLLCVLPQITEKLLESEEKKLRVLKREIEASKQTDAPKDSSKVSSLNF